MERRGQSLLLKSAILTMSFVQLCTNAIGPFLADIGRAFPEAPTEKVQFLMTFPSLFGTVFMFTSAVIARKFGKKLMAVLGLAIVAASGIGAVLAHPSLGVLFFWAAVMGIGYGLVCPVAPALIGESFQGREAQNMLGLQSSAGTIGSMLMTLFGGMLAARGWWYGYLVYLIALPGLVLSLAGVHERRECAAGPSKSLPLLPLVKQTAKVLVTAFVFTFLSSSVPSNLSMFIMENDLGNAGTSGIVSALYLAGGMTAGFLYGPLSAKIGSKTSVLAMLILAAGTLAASFARNIAVLSVIFFFGGMAISFMMPYLMQTPGRYPQDGAFVSALIMGVGNLGLFSGPVLTPVTNFIFGEDLAGNRFLMIGVLSLLFTVPVWLFFVRGERRDPAAQHGRGN